MRRKTRAVKAGTLIIGGGFPVSVQTMWKEPLAKDTLMAVGRRITDFASAGCGLVRFAVPDIEAAELLGDLAASSPVPLVADIHFDYRLALRCMDFPIAKVRINPGNIGEAWKVREVVAKAKDRGISLRVGVNGGSLPRGLNEQKNKAAAMVTAAEIEMEVLDSLGFQDVVFSLKSADPQVTVKANALFSRKYDHPLHIGATASGPLIPGLIKNTIAIFGLLRKGLGDTIRVSLSGSPEQELEAGLELLRAAGAQLSTPEIISCPKCGRASFDVEEFSKKVSLLVQKIKRPLKIAVMGCPVNGVDEAKHADLGITGAGKMAIIFRKGAIVSRVRLETAFEEFRREVEKLCADT